MSLPKTRKAAAKWYTEKLTAALEKGEEHYHEARRWLVRNDLFYLLVAVLNRKDMNKNWLFDRCREVQASPNGHLDLWAREHYKSTIITYALTIQDLMNDPNRTFGFFSHTRPIAKGFLRQIKREFEENEDLKSLFPDILYEFPQRQSPKWSEDDGIIIKRTSNPKEATIEAYGLVDGQPTSKHYTDLVFDDVVTKESVSTPEMIKKVTDSWALALNLGTMEGNRRTIGTRYHFNDTYATMIERKSVKVRLKPATINGKPKGDPVFMPAKLLEEKRRDMGVYTFACQMLQNPKPDNVQGFDRDWLGYWSGVGETRSNTYILVDPANEKKKKSDYTAAWVVEACDDKNYRIRDMVRDRLNLPERADLLFEWHKKYQPIRVGYEKYGKDSDIQHFEDRMEREKYKFKITPLGGQLSKTDRIRTLVPDFEQGRILLPEELWYTNYEEEFVDLVQVFINMEYLAFPLATHDDLLDALARLNDPAMRVKFPVPRQGRSKRQTTTNRGGKILRRARAS